MVSSILQIFRSFSGIPSSQCNIIYANSPTSQNPHVKPNQNLNTSLTLICTCHACAYAQCLRSTFLTKPLTPPCANHGFAYAKCSYDKALIKTIQSGFWGRSPQFLAIEPHFVRKGCAGHLKSQFYLSFWRSNLISCERVAPDTYKSQFYFSFWRSNFISCERVATGTRKSQFYFSFSPSNLISCEKVRRTLCKSQFYFSF